MSFLIGDRWIDAQRGSFVVAPGGVMNGFENRSDEQAGILNVSVPGGFEQNMGEIVDWNKKYPPKELCGE